MATRFEVVLPGDDPVALRAAGEAALNEIERLENVLSLYRPSSEIAEVNARAGVEPVRVSVPVFRLLEHALAIASDTGGTFDMTIGPLMKCWGLMADTGRVPPAEELAEARARVGWQFIDLDASRFTVRFGRPGMMIDLGAIGKGYAIDCALEQLLEAGVRSALIHGGTSSIYGLGHPPDAAGWTIALRGPGERDGAEPGFDDQLPSADLPTYRLRDGALSVSAVWGKSFQTADRRYGHVIDPRVGEPAGDAVMAAVALPSTTESDAFSTALLVLGEQGVPKMSEWRAGAQCLVLVTDGGGGRRLVTSASGT